MEHYTGRLTLSRDLLESIHRGGMEGVGLNACTTTERSVLRRLNDIFHQRGAASRLRKEYLSKPHVFAPD